MTAHSVHPQRKTEISLEARDQIVLDHLLLVKAIAIRVHQNLPVHIEIDDLIQAGVLGLLDAVEKYDGSKNVVFQDYAKHRIKGAILDSLRQLDWASRDMRRRQRQVETVSRNLYSELGRTPTEVEIARQMGMTTDQWSRMAADLRHGGPISISPREDLDRPEEMQFAAPSDGRPDRICERRVLCVALERAMGQLSQRYRKIVFLYYIKQMTMKHIGHLFGVNESRISQIHRMALKKMQTVLQSEGICSLNAL
jgi:RNA polymerase sigma factor for flagellar operon FliA